MAKAKSAHNPQRQTRQAGGLLRKLTRNANLPAYIRQLPAGTLSRLIEDVGLEDSQEILALVGPEQLKAVLSVALWNAPKPGQQEEFDLDEFVRWVEVWLQEGESTLVRRVVELGENFVVMCLSKLLVAVDRTTVGLRESGFEIGQYMIFPRQEKHWNRVTDTLGVLWHHEPDFVLYVLRRCSFERSILNDDATEPGSRESLYEDLAAERIAERVGIGFVNPMHAALFLMHAKTTDLAQLCATGEYDVNTADYLGKQRDIVHRSVADDASIGAGAEDSPDGGSEPREPERTVAGGAADLNVATADVISQADKEALDSLLRDAGVLQPAPAVVLLTDQRAGPARSELLETTLASLAQTRPDVVSRRLGELAYLSNTLMAGAEIQGKVFTEAEAAKVALATANLGIGYLLRAAAGSPNEAERARALLEEDPGVVRLFQVGYHLLCKIPSRVCEAVYAAKAVQARRPGHIIIMEMDEVLGSGRLTDRVNEGLYGEAKSLIDGLAAALDSAACVALRILIDPIPCFPRVLSGGNAASTYVDKGYRHIATLEDLELIGTFLRSLPDYCGN